MIKVCIVIGTRPEAIKCAPLVRLVRQGGQGQKVELSVISTGQHREMLLPVFDFFGYSPDFNLDLMRRGQSLNGIVADVTRELEPLLQRLAPDWVLVQGDTTTAAAASWCASNLQIRVGHIEAGLRTGDRKNPFPEENNRRLISALATRHFAPTLRARRALEREGVPEHDILVTGNTVIDALLWARDRVKDGFADLVPHLENLAARRQRVVLVTGHRRESFGQGFESICSAIKRLAQDSPNVAFVYPVHLNPRVQEPVLRLLDGLPNVFLLPPLDYPNFVWLLNRAHLVLTDSGGVQEEAPSLGVPVLVMRETTERPEGVESGNASLVGVDENRIYERVMCLLNDDKAHAAMAAVSNPYGDGKAAERIAASLLDNSLAR
jgi:UDP-N-acetylglucosamine 2-epimerase (non-hydrolysing)